MILFYHYLIFGHVLSSVILTLHLNNFLLYKPAEKQNSKESISWDSTDALAGGNL